MSDLDFKNVMQKRNRLQKKSTTNFELSSPPVELATKTQQEGGLPYFHQKLVDVNSNVCRNDAHRSMTAAMKSRDKRFFVDIKNRCGLAEKPSELIKGQSELISQVGYSSSYMEAGQDRDMSDPSYLWWVVNKGVLNTKTPEGQLFKENLRANLKKTSDDIERKLRL